MTLINNYVVAYGQIKSLFEKMREAEAPPKFTHQYLKDIGLGSSNFRSVIPLLKSLGFLTSDGSPTQRYHEYRGSPEPRKVLGQALRENYSDIFTIKSNPTRQDKNVIQGKFKSTFNTNDRTAGLMTSTFLALLDIADINTNEKPEPSAHADSEDQGNAGPEISGTSYGGAKGSGLGGVAFHYNIQIHLPATKDIEVYSAIFKSLKEHLLE